MSALPLRFALVGNPNCGKTSLFNRLTGARAKVANYPGVTVERRAGMIKQLGTPVQLIDLPGTYSLHTTSPDEQVARDMILGRMPGETIPDLLVAVVDATNLRLGLQLVMQLKTLNRPLILVLNLMDAARNRGISIEMDGLAQALGVPVVETVAVRQGGVAHLLAELNAFTQRVLPAHTTSTAATLALSAPASTVYAHIEDLMGQHVTQPTSTHTSWQDKLDSIVMHPLLGWFVLLTVLLLTFQAVFAWAKPLQEMISEGVGGIGSWVGVLLPEGVLQDFLVNGLIAGTGSVLVFLPQIVILFFFILVLEDSGYLPRAAFLLDRPMRAVGLSGRSFIPMLSSFACAVPGIMATRTIQNPRERFITIMTAPLMTCSARLPVYALLIGAFIPNLTVWSLFNLQGLVLLGLYVLGIVSAVAVAWVMGWGKQAKAFPLILELPNYRRPMPYQLFLGLRERATIFLRRVGTVILAMSIVLWFLASYPHPPLNAVHPAIEYSFAGMIGQFIQPLFAPLGFSWQMVLALIPAMAAREVAVSALATVYAAAGAGEDAISSSLAPILAHSWSLPVALAFLAWFVYAPQCLSTVSTIRRETNSRAATVFFVVYLLVLAYAASWITYRLALLCV